MFKWREKLGIAKEEDKRQDPKIRQFSIRIDDPLFTAENELAKELKSLLKQPKKLINEFKALGYSRQETSSDGIRTLRGILKSFPEKIVTLSGLGVVRFINYPNHSFIVEPPHWKESLSKYMKTGHMQISAEGDVWRQRNETVFGAYDLDDLRTKMENTYKFAHLINKPNTLEILLAGVHQKSKQHGWMVYSLPANAIRSHELQGLDLLERKSAQEVGLFGQYIDVLFSRIRDMHEESVVHLELHPGNCFPTPERNGEMNVVVTDWTTAHMLSDLTKEEDLLKKGYVKEESAQAASTAKKTAIMTDLYIALQNTLVLSDINKIDLSREDTKKIQIEINSVLMTKDMMNTQLTFIAVAMAAYSRRGVDNIEKMRKIVEKVFYEEVIPEVLQKDKSIKKEWEEAGGDIDKMHGAMALYFISLALDILTTKVAVLLAESNH